MDVIPNRANTVENEQDSLMASRPTPLFAVLCDGWFSCFSFAAEFLNCWVIVRRLLLKTETRRCISI